MKTCKPDDYETNIKAVLDFNKTIVTAVLDGKPDAAQAPAAAEAEGDDDDYQ